jgi:HPt (histidine-containing phosphotransfer) domain-containing protein
VFPLSLSAKLTTGEKGEDRNGEYDVVAINGNKLTYRYSDGTTHEGDLAIKQRINDGIQAEKARANEPKKIPGYLREDEIEWTPEMSWFLGYLAGPGKARIFAEAPPKYEEAVVNKYHDLTGIILEEKPGVFNIAPETKWSPELAVMFRPTEEIPDDIARQQQKPGLVNRNQFVWSLVRNGFRFGERPNVDLIRSKVPESMQDYFDIGADQAPQQVQAALGTNRDYKTMDRKVRNSLALHKQLMDKYITEGMTPEDASHKAFQEVRALGNKGVAKEFEKEAVTIMTYGMGQPIGGTESGNPDPDDTEDVENATLLNMTSSIDNDYDPDVEDQAFFAALDAEEEEADSRARSFAAVIDNTDLETIGKKLASSEEISWFAKSARPSPQKIELLTKQFKLTPEQIELCINTDPSPNQSDYVAWIAKFLSKGAFMLPEDSERIKGQLEKFQKFKKSPLFLFSKDLQQYDPAKLFETLQEAEAKGMTSEKEKKRENVRQGAEIVVKEGPVTIYKVTEVKAANELGGGTNWCTAIPGASHAQSYLSRGPLYIFFDSGSAVAQLHCEDNLFMNRADVCILENVTGQSSRYEQGRIKKFLADPNLAKALQMLAAKDTRVAEWAKENVADQEDVKKILGEAAAAEVEENTQYDKQMEDYNKALVEYNAKMEEYRPKHEKWNKEYEKYQQKMNEYHKKQEEWQAQDPSHGTSANPVPFWLERDRPKAPSRPDEPRQPHHPGRGYGYGYGEDRDRSGKKFIMQVKHALASGVPLPPEIEAQLVDSGMKTELLLKYGSQFHPGQPWEPLSKAIMRDVAAGKANKKEMTDYAVKFLKGRWPEAEPMFLSKMFLLQNNMQNMQSALEYARRVVKGRWPEFEKEIQKAKPGLASGYGAAEYAINVLKEPWHQLPGIKRKKTTGRINAEDCMIKGNPGEARKYAEAFYQGKRWEDFETAALEADNLNALINYAEGTLHARMPALEEKILSGTKDAQESKGRRRYRKYTDLPLEYAKKVVKGRWPEYEQKVLDFIKTTDKGEHSGNSYKPSHSENNNSWYRDQRISAKVTDYIEQVIQGRWPEMEAILLGRYAEKPGRWGQNQNMIDGYLTAVADVCKKRNAKPTSENDDDDNLVNQPMGTRTKPNDSRVQQPFSTDAQCQWPEGEARLVTRDPGYEAILLEELKKKADDDSKDEKRVDKGVSLEELRKMEKAPEDISWKSRDEKPNWTVAPGGYWVGWYGMDKFEHYVGYMWANNQDWPEGVEIMEILNELEDVRGRLSHEKRVNWRRTPEQPKAEGATASMKKKFQSSLLNRKKALVEMHNAPTMLPPRDDMKRHMDEQEQQAITDDVMQGVNPNDPTQMPHKPGMIDPRINPDGVVASKQADYDQRLDEENEYFLDQVRDAENEAKRSLHGRRVHAATLQRLHSTEVHGRTLEDHEGRVHR